jgi:hypothetical protein
MGTHISGLCAFTFNVYCQFVPVGVAAKPVLDLYRKKSLEKGLVTRPGPRPNLN